ncbi:MAG: hypothetical protein IPN03_06425 [Holophagales bacterium]|nr:hypothetical protein [Holophagales bacterium]
MLRLGSTRLPSTNAWLVFNTFILLIFGVFSLGIGVLAILDKKRLGIASAAMLLASLAGCLHYFAFHKRKLRRVLGVLANSLYAMLLSYVAVDVIRDGDIVGGLAITATAIGFFILPGLAALRRSG